ncbi:MAG TPA: 3-phosphoshikimate 1-carboxyvinyltransferase [Vicinamibacterales bacterium]|nr:3-phosphoshikimate 1-carboxyvinyltransferase [Vicinamibacterales bacterium]
MSHAPADAAMVRPSARAAGRLRVPGDKSISHRYAMLAAMADGVSYIRGYLTGADCLATLDCLRALGVEIRHDGRGNVEIEGRGLNGLAAPSRPLDAANSGTSMRLLAGMVAAHPFRSVLTGDESLSRRPMRRVIAPLTEMGASIAAHDGKPPLTIDGAHLRAITFQPEVPSAQVKSAVLLAGLQAKGQTVVVEPIATRDHTERALEAFGVTVDREDGRIAIAGGQRLAARNLTVPGDVSSATFWIALAAGTPGADIEIEGVGLNPTRTAMIEVARRAGAIVDARNENEAAGEPAGTIRVSYGSPRSFEISPTDVPGLIDEIPALAALGALLPPGAEMSVRGAAELRVKESDRITCLARGFRAMGADIEEFPDGFRLVSQPLVGATVDAAGDHRLAMAFALAATRAASPTTIVGASSVSVSYPGFFDALERLTR